MEATMSQPEKPLQVVEGRCIHWAGLFEPPNMTKIPCCNAGVNYEQLAGAGPGLFTRLPCVDDGADLDQDPDVVRCEKRQLPTAEQLKAWKDHAEQSMRLHIQAIQACQKDASERRATSGQIKCPRCEAGQVVYSISRSNGHLGGRCTTRDCLNWMQ